MLIEVPTNKPLAALDQDFRAAAERHKFGVLAVVYEVCNPDIAKKVLETNGAISTALPCRISVYSEGGVT